MAKAKKIGFFGGVFTPSILTILGVIMYLRLPWIVGQAGLWATLGIILVAHIISGSTGLSVASIATDKKVESGGTYYIISRSLGLSIGGTLGLALFVGLSFSVSLYLIGFAEVFLSYFGFEVTLMNIRIAGTAVLILLTILTFISTSLVIKSQYLILTVMILSVLSVVLGNHDYVPAAPQLESLPDALPWITLFAIFFPAVTGFEAGVSMSGDLKDPRRAIPLGTILAIVTGLLVYVGLTFFFSYCVDANQLVSNPDILFDISWIPQLVIAGILGATLSSALGSILGAPRILQAVAKDRIAPRFLSKGFGASNEPRNALMFTFLIAEAGILIGELNAIARIVTIFFIITYGFLNITYTVESWFSSDFHPRFRIPRVVSIIGALACIIVMIQLDILALAMASVVLLALFFFLKKKELNLVSGDSQMSVWLSLVKSGLVRLSRSKMNNRNWRPNVILFSGGVSSRPHLMEIAHALVGKLGIFTNFELVEHPNDTELFDKTASVSVESFGDVHNIVTRKHNCKNIYEGISMISSVYGFSGFEPNTVLMGWPRNTQDPQKMKELLMNLTRSDYNLCLFSHEKNTDFGKNRRIDCWWSGTGRNLSLALHQIRYITATPKWRHAEVRILAINPQSAHTERYHALLTQVLDNYRIKAEIRVIPNIDKQSTRNIIHAESFDSDLTLIEIPDFNKNNIDAVWTELDGIAASLKSALFIKASSVFDVLNVLPELPGTKAKQVAKVDHVRIPASVTLDLQMPEHELVSQLVTHLAEVTDVAAQGFLNNSLYLLQERRHRFLDQLQLLTQRTAERLKKARTIKIADEQQWELLKILNDYSFRVSRQLESYDEVYLSFEQKLLASGTSRLIAASGNALKSLPAVLRMQFSREEVRNVPTANALERMNRWFKLLYSAIGNKKVTLTIRPDSIASWHLYHKRLEHLHQFYNDLVAQSLASFGTVRELFSNQHELLHNACIGQLDDKEIDLAIEDSLEQIAQLKIDLNEFVLQQGTSLMQGLTTGLQNFSRDLSSPQAGLLHRQYRHALKKQSLSAEKLFVYSDSWYELMQHYVNKSRLDFVFLTLKNRLLSKIDKTMSEVETTIELTTLTQMEAARKQIKEWLTVAADEGSRQGLPYKSLKLPVIDVLFTDLLDEICKAVGELPETIVILGEAIPADPEMETLVELIKYQVAIRKTAEYYVSKEMNEQIRRQSQQFSLEMSQTASALHNNFRLANFQIENLGNSEGEIVDNLSGAEQLKQLAETLQNDILAAEKKVAESLAMLAKQIDKSLNRAFEPLSSALIMKTTGTLTHTIRQNGKHKLFTRLSESWNAFKQNTSNRMVSLFYHRSRSVLWSNRMESRQQTPVIGMSSKQLIANFTLEKSLLESLPFYYANLFSESSVIGEEFWIGMEDELSRAALLVDRFQSGEKGLLMISGGRNTGKTSLSRRIAELSFDKKNIYTLKSPKSCSSDLQHFELNLANALHANEDMYRWLDELTVPSVVIINDLELWWERRPQGTAVIQHIIHLSQQYGNKILFIVNVHEQSLVLIDQLTQLRTWSLDTIICRPFDARQLRDMILLRHQSGGLKLVIDKQNEDEMSNWEYAKIFNRIFDLSGGNPGTAITIWLSCITNISGNILFMKKPSDQDNRLNEEFTETEMLLLLQLVLHRRLSKETLSELLQTDVDVLTDRLNLLLQKGVLRKPATDVYGVHPLVEMHLIKKLKNLELL